jgi:hypothetical protein
MLGLIREIFHECCEDFQTPRSSRWWASATILIRHFHIGQREQLALRTIAANLLTESLDLRLSPRSYLDAGQGGFQRPDDSVISRAPSAFSAERCGDDAFQNEGTKPVSTGQQIWLGNACLAPN